MYRIVLFFMMSVLLNVICPESMKAFGADNSQRVASVTCAVLRETRKMDSAIRVEKMNEAREKLGLPPFLSGDDEIIRSIKYGTCELLVLNSPNYESTTQRIVSNYLEQKRVQEEKKAEADKIAAKKKAEADKIAEQERAKAEQKKEEELNKKLIAWEEAARKEISKWKVVKEKLTYRELSDFEDSRRFFFELRFLESGNLEGGMTLFCDVIVEFNDKTLPIFKTEEPGSSISSTIRSMIQVPSCSPENNDCTSLVTLSNPKITREIRKKFFDAFTSGEPVQFIEFPKDSYNVTLIIKGISYYGEPYDFTREFYPELKVKGGFFDDKYQFIKPITIAIEAISEDPGLNTEETRILNTEETRIINMLISDNNVTKRDAAKTIFRNSQMSVEVYDAASSALKQMLENGNLDENISLDTMAWLCKAVGASRNDKYEYVLILAAESDSRKLRNYAKAALKDLRL